MEILTCKMCGGNISVSEDQTYGTCEYCGSTMTLPKIENQQRANLYNRANHFRRQNEFDKAMAAYENILNFDSTDAEAHWGIVLSRFGIEYVEDPASHERIPTCHRTQFESILADEDYQAALENAPDSYTRSLYEQEAKRIAEIQKGILAISANEKPYDVFICYKETGDNGERTKDSVLAQDIYYQLTNEGYKVFFSRITLEEKLGQQYEPYIFAALNSARVMLVIGTKAANFQAVWVRNEWRRYLDLMKKDQGRLLIPCYRDMDPYDLPEELSLLQSQDMSKIGFVQDLLHGVKKVLEGKQQTSSKSSSENAFGDAELEKLLKNAQTYLKLNDYGLAQKTYSSVIEKYPEDYRGWWGLIICDTHSLQQNAEDQKRLDTWFGYIKQLADPEAFREVEKEYALYLRKISETSAEKEIVNVNRIIHDYMEKLQACEENIRKIAGRVQQRNQMMQQQTEEFNNNLFCHQSEMEKNTKSLKNKKAAFVIGLILLIGGLIGVAVALNIDSRASSFVLLFGLCFMSSIVVLVISDKGLSTNELRENVEMAQNNIAYLQNRFVDMQEDYKRMIADSSARTAGEQKQITDIQNKIKLCRQYLGLGKERLEKLLFVKKCAELGIQTQEDQDAAAEQLRYQVFR